MVVPDAGTVVVPLNKKDCSKMLGFLNYRADPTKNKSRKDMVDAQKALEA